MIVSGSGSDCGDPLYLTPNGNGVTAVSNGLMDDIPSGKLDVYRSRFHSKYKPTEDGCHAWLGAIDRHGYGKFHAMKNVRAHRFAWFIANGPIPSDMVIDHICRNRKCVNVGHLRLLSNKENILIGVGWGAINANKTHCMRGHEFTSSNTIRTKRGGRRCRECKNAARRYEDGSRSIPGPVAKLMEMLTTGGDEG